MIYELGIALAAHLIKSEIKAARMNMYNTEILFIQDINGI